MNQKKVVCLTSLPMGESFVLPGLGIGPKKLPCNGQDGKLEASLLCRWLDKVAMQWTESESQRHLSDGAGSLVTRGRACWLILGAILLLQVQKVGWPRRGGVKLRREVSA
jgi:hypothetical protein